MAASAAGRRQRVGRRRAERLVCREFGRRIRAGDDAADVTFFASSLDNAEGSRRADCTWGDGGAASFFPPSFDGVNRFFAFGTTTVGCSAVDGSGNTGDASFTITVRDTIAPFLNVPSQFMIDATGASGATVNFLGPVSAFDSVDGQVTPPCTPATLPIAKVAAQPAAINYDQRKRLLQNAFASLNAGNINTACSQLGADINQIQAQIGKKISAADAAALMQLVNAAREAMGC